MKIRKQNKKTKNDKNSWLWINSNKNIDLSSFWNICKGLTKLRKQYDLMRISSEIFRITKSQLCQLLKKVT